MRFLSIKTPWILKQLFPNYIWAIPTKKSEVYLTFDDGPTPEVTEKVLDLLNEYQAKATFFCIGKNVEENPHIFRRILDEEHAVGNHTYHHVKGWNVNTKTYIENTLKAERTIQQINKSINQPKFFRPPYGKIKPSQSRQLRNNEYKIVMWDVLSLDWSTNITQEKVLNNVIKNTISGSIVVFHDSMKASKNMLYALPKVLEHFSERGYSFKSLSGNF